MCTDDSSVDADFEALAYSYEKPRVQGNAIMTLGERRLWCAVIEQAFIDAGYISASRAIEKNKTAERDRDDAIRWLQRDKQNFSYVCIMAGLSPAVIRRAATLLM